jgi:hypothetical protein
MISIEPRRRYDARARFLTEDHVRVLQRLARLRVATASQLHRLAEPLTGHHRSNTQQRLARMVKHGLLQTGKLRPFRGAFSVHYYQLAYPGLTALGRTRETALIRRPRQHILEYLVFRAEVCATARAAGWRLAGPTLTPEPDHRAYLAVFGEWARRALKKRLEGLRLARASRDLIARAEQDVDRLHRFLPAALTFDFLFRLGTDRAPEDLLLAIVDDPRRSIEAQVRLLPPEIYPGMRLLLRDHLTRYDLASREPYRMNNRLLRWRRALVGRYQELGEELVRSDTLFPDLWAVRTATPELSSTRSSSTEAA